MTQEIKEIHHNKVWFTVKETSFTIKVLTPGRLTKPTLSYFYNDHLFMRSDNNNN